MTEQSNELLIETHETCPNWFLLHSQKWMQQYLIYIFMIVIVILIMDMVIKKILKTHFVTKSDTIMWRRENENVKILTKKMKVYIIITVVKVIWVVLIVHQSILQLMRRTYKHILLMKMVILIMAIWMLLILMILLFSLLNQMEALITSLVMRVLKKSYWYLRLYEERMLTLVPKVMCLIDSATTYTILKSNKIFSCLIMWDINVSIIYSTTNILKALEELLYFYQEVE